jgi:hypothetical protein
MERNANPDGLAEVLQRWKTLRFFPHAIEATVAQNWPLLIVIPATLALSVGYYSVRHEHSLPSTDNVTMLIRDPYIASLLIALIISGIAFTLWERNFRETFAQAVEAGFVSNTPSATDGFLQLSNAFFLMLRSRWRYVGIGALLMFTMVATYRDLQAVIHYFSYSWIDYYLMGAWLCFLIFPMRLALWPGVFSRAPDGLRGYQRAK